MNSRLCSIIVVTVVSSARFFIALGLLLLPAFASAELTRVEVLSRMPFANGTEFGLAGSYEELSGRMHFAIDPALTTNTVIRDIQHAPLDAEGMVEFSADFRLLKPTNVRRSNGTLLFEVANRGNMLMLRRFNRVPRSPASNSFEPEAGDGFLFRHGFVLLWVGWELDVENSRGTVRLYAPVAGTATDPVRGIVRSDFVVREHDELSDFVLRQSDAPAQSLAAEGTIAYPVADPDDPR
jgi:hypothetical protein